MKLIWIRPLSLVFGTTTYAVSIIIAGFLSGLALGSWIASKFSDKIDNPLKIYGFIEIGIGLYGLNVNFIIFILARDLSWTLSIYISKYRNILYFTIYVSIWNNFNSNYIDGCYITDSIEIIFKKF